MSIPLEEILAYFTGKPGASEQLLQTAETALGIILPEDYRSFLKHFDGGEGFIGKHYLIFWKAEELERFNRHYRVNEYAPKFYLFGTDGGGEGFAFDARSSPYRVVLIPFVGMTADSAIFVANTFTEFLERLVGDKESLFKSPGD